MQRKYKNRLTYNTMNYFFYYVRKGKDVSLIVLTSSFTVILYFKMVAEKLYCERLILSFPFPCYCYLKYILLL